MQTLFQHSKITALIGVSAKDIFSLDEVCKNFADDHTISRLKKNIGFESLRILDKNKCVTDLAIAGITKLIESKLINIQDIDALVFVSETPDYQVPFPCYILQKHFDFNHDCFMVDEIKGCSGFVDALFFAATMIEQKQFKKIIICAGDANVRPDENTDQRLNMSIFADGIGVAVVEYSDQEIKSFFEVHNDGNLYRSVIFEDMPGCAYRYKRGQKIDHRGMYIDGAVLASYILDKCVEYQRRLFEFSSLQPSQISKIICHQANRLLVKSFALRLGLTLEQVPFVALNTGNTGAASIPLALSEYFSKQRNGLCSLTGFGAGLSFCAGILDLSETNILPAIYI